jgi:MFS superfamily sulfate permease-like transporter
MQTAGKCPKRRFESDKLAFVNKDYRKLFLDFNKGKKIMINENEFDYVDTTDEQLEQALNKAVEDAKIALQMSENYYREFGKQSLTETQKAFFESMASGIIPSNEEQITVGLELVKQGRELVKQQRAELGEAYKPILTFEDKTDSFPVN